MRYSDELDGVLYEIAEAKTARELRLAGASAKALEEKEKEIARWAYAYAKAQIGTEMTRV